MDEPTDPKKTPAATSTDGSKTFTQVVEAMKEQSKDEAQRTIASQDKMGKPQAFTEACSVMKDEIDREAEQILSPQDSPKKPPRQSVDRSAIDDGSKTSEQQTSPESGIK
jgi:hypothetical protein